MEEYQVIGSCRMQYLRAQLDDPADEPCGICDNCRAERFGAAPDADVVAAAGDRLLHDHVEVAPRKQWAAGVDGISGRIAAEHQADTGWCLARAGQSGWGPAIAEGRDEGAYADELVDALAEMCRERIEPLPAAVVFVPSLRRPELVASLATRLAERLSLPVVDAITATRPTEPQAEMHNSTAQLRNVWSAFAVDASAVAKTPEVLLVDDLIDSRWTMTVVAHELFAVGCGRVVPVALASLAP